jgi:hypothetical protein
VTRWQVFALSFDVSRNGFGVWEPLGRAWWSYRDASLWRDEMRACGAGTVFEVQEEQPSPDPNFVRRVA